MIDQKELRIGNLFLNAINEIDVVTELSKQYVTGKNHAVPYGAVNPLPLSDEISKTLGFDYDGYKIQIPIGEGQLWLKRNGNEVWLLSVNDVLVVKLRYAHEVQNIVFAIVQVELIDQNITDVHRPLL